MSRCLLIIGLLSLSACGVQGDLYLPDQPRPPKRDRSTAPIPSPYPEQPPEEQEVLPDVI